MKQVKEFNNPNLINSHIYLKQTIKDGEKLYIGVLDNIDDNVYTINYKLSKGFFFFIPTDNKLKGYCYDAKDPVTINKYRDELYILSDTEYLDTFRAFVKNDGLLKDELENELIKAS